MRVALGASRMRIARQLLSESLLLSGVGALLGLVFAQWGSRLLVRQLSTSTNTVFLSLPLDWRVLGFTAGIAVATAVLFGMAPALRGTRVQPNDALKAQGRGVVGDGRLGLGNVLVVLQVALSLVLIVAAGLFVRTFSSLASLNTGFDRDPILVASLNAQRAQLEPAARPALFQRALEAAAGVPGVASAALSAVTPVSGSTWNNRIELPDGPALSEKERITYINLVSTGWFRTYGTPIIAGRDFTPADTMGSSPVAIVNETFARKFAYGKNPVGTRVRQPGFGGRPTIDRQIVGYVRDAVYRSLREPVPPTMYLPYAQQPEPPSFMSISVRAAGGPPALLTRPLAAALTDVNRDIAITFRPLEDQVNAALTQERIVAMLSGFFGGAGAAARGAGAVRRHVLRRQPAADRDRHPHGARRRARRRRPPRAAPRGDPGRPRRRRRHRRQPVGRAFRGDAPLWAAAARSADGRGGRRAPRHDRGAGRLAAGAPRRADRSRAGIARRVERRLILLCFRSRSRPARSDPLRAATMSMLVMDAYLPPLIARLPAEPVTRFAPAPTGWLHLGHVLNAYYVWEIARAIDGRVLLRIEDHDRTRARPEFEAGILEDLDWLGFHADIHPTDRFRAGRCDGRQSDRNSVYREALEILRARGLVYACDCSRASLAPAAAGPGRPHEHDVAIGLLRAEQARTADQAELHYPGRCRDRQLPLVDGYGWRVRMDPGVEIFDDVKLGEQRQDP